MVVTAINVTSCDSNVVGTSPVVRFPWMDRVPAEKYLDTLCSHGTILQHVCRSGHAAVSQGFALIRGAALDEGRAWRSVQ